MPSVLGRRKRATPSNTPKKRQKIVIIGCCTKTIMKCVMHKRYLCADCYPVDSKDYLIKAPPYLDGSEMRCSWKNANKLSYPKHNKRYHGSTKKHNVGFKANDTPSKLKQKPLLFVNINDSNHNNIDPEIEILPNIEESENVFDGGLSYNVSSLVLEIEDNISTLHISPKKKQIQPTLENYSFSTNKNIKTANKSNQRYQQIQIPSDVDCKYSDDPKVRNPDFLHLNNAEWSVLKQKANQYHLGCFICFRYDDKNMTMYACNEYPTQFTIIDFMNNYKNWITMSHRHRRHPTMRGHLYALERAGKVNIFNDKALESQIEVYLDMVRYKKPDTDYTRSLHLISRCNGFTGNIGLSRRRLKDLDNITHIHLKENVRKQINKPRPWGGTVFISIHTISIYLYTVYLGPNSFITTMDVYSCGSMSTEMHVMMKMLPDPTKLIFIAIPFALSPITSKEGQSKKLTDSAARCSMA